jgi:CheY-like chemotaxis protein
LHAIRAMQCRAPVIVLSGHSDAQTAVTALRAGAADYLAKAISRRPASKRRQPCAEQDQPREAAPRASQAVGTMHRNLQQRHEELRASIDILSRDLAGSFGALQTFLAAFEGETALTDEQRARLDEALECCLGLRRLVGDLGSSLSVDDELHQAVAVATDVHALLQDVLDPLASEASSKQVTIDAAVAASIPPVAAPPSLVKSLRDVVRRAIQGTPSQGTVRLRATKSPVRSRFTSTTARRPDCRAGRPAARASARRPLAGQHRALEGRLAAAHDANAAPAARGRSAARVARRIAAQRRAAAAAR